MVFKRSLRVLVLTAILLVGLMSDTSRAQMIPFAMWQADSSANGAGVALRFKAASTSCFTKSMAGGSGTTWTWSGWVKNASAATSGDLFSSVQTTGNGEQGALGFAGYAAGQLQFYNYSPGYQGRKVTTNIFRDPSAWYHIVSVWDTTNAVAADRMRLYVNGVRITSFAVSSDPSLNQAHYTVNTSFGMGVGCQNRNNGTLLYGWDGYMADVQFVDGTALNASSFGQFDGNGQWVPITYTGNYGTNGFHLEFADTSANTAAGIGKDTSGKGNNWLPNNVTLSNTITGDNVLDSPASGNNYATWNPVDTSTAYTYTSPVITDGNLKTTSSASYQIYTSSSMGWPSGKYYFEVKIAGIGVAGATYIGINGGGVGAYAADGSMINLSPGTAGAAYTTNDVIGVAFDSSTKSLEFFKNGVSQGARTFSAGTPPYYVFVSNHSSSGSMIVNFGQNAFSYTPPAGYLKLNTANLPTPAIKTPSSYLKIATYTGNGSYMTIGDPVKLAGATNIANSLRFQPANSPQLARTISPTGSSTKWTWSAWVKLGPTRASFRNLFSAVVGGGATTEVDISTADKLAFYWNSTNNVTTTETLRDSSRWYHLVVVWDTGNATANDRIRLYIDGRRITAFDTNTQPALNTASIFNTNSAVNWIGRYSSYAFDGYMADVYMIDNQALDASSFGAADANGNWAPKAYSGSYGTSGYHLDFADTSNTTATTMGKDVSGNGNNWTPSGFSVAAGAANDMLRDTPTPYNDGTYDHGNFATWNPLTGASSVALSGGNLQALSSINSTNTNKLSSTLSASSGKWYAEFSPANTYSYSYIGFLPVSAVNPNSFVGGTAGSCGYEAGTGNLYCNNALQATYTGVTAGQTVMVAMDLDNGKCWWGINGTWLNSGNPATGTNALYSFAVTERMAFGLSPYASSGTWTANFGQRPFAYAAPAGFKTLSTNNIANDNFTPDLVIIKSRSAATGWGWYDRMRGATIDADPANAAADTVQSTGLLAFQNGGFTVGSLAKLNTSGTSYVAYMFKKAPLAGFDIVNYLGSASSQTVPHALGAVPKFMITRSYNSTSDWGVYHAGLTSANRMFLNLTNASGAGTTWNSTDPTSSVFTVGSGLSSNNPGYLMSGYLWSEVPGFSKMGSYTGNGATDGPFVYTGFRPALVLIKRTDTTGDWYAYDATRDPINPVQNNLYPNLSSAEFVGTARHDFLANGFKIRDNSVGFNASGGSYVYVVFAEKPLSYSSAR